MSIVRTRRWREDPRLDDRKGYRFLVEASRALPDVRFVVAGEGTPPRARGRMKFVGPIEDAPAFLAPAALYVQPSRWEGFPNAAIEAMACGLIRPPFRASCGRIKFV